MNIHLRRSNMIEIQKVGLQAQWTDGGRRLAQSHGYSQSGAVDWLSFHLANALCKNPLNFPAIEVMAGQFRFIAKFNGYLCVTGTDCHFTINNKKTIINQIYTIKNKDVIDLGAVKKGLFNYVTFAFNNKRCIPQLPTFKSSVCATKRESIGGLTSDGRGLKQGDVIQFIETDDKRIQSQYGFSSVPPNQISTTAFGEDLKRMVSTIISKQRSNKLPVVFSYQANKFENIQKARFLASEYTISASLDKMGVRLDGPSIKYSSAKLTSQPIALGAIQIPSNGMPIIMRNERQTIGGYPIIGVVSRLGLTRLSQMTPGLKISFESQSHESALCEYRLIQNQLLRIMQR